MDNVVLRERCLSSISLLKRLRESLVRGHVHNVFDDDVFMRGEAVAEILNAILSLLENQFYVTALATCRSALEAALSDRLSISYDVYIDYFTFGTVESGDQWLANDVPQLVASGAIVLARRHENCPKKNQRCIEIVRKAQSLGPDGEVHSLPGVRLLRIERQYPAPTTRHREHFRGRSFPYIGDHDHDSSAQHFYRHHLRWSTILEQLPVLNSMTRVEAEILDNHFDYLSLFVHPQTNTRAILWPTTHAVFMGTDLIVERLILLYLCSLGGLELESLAAYVAQRPQIESPDLAEWKADAAEQEFALQVRSELGFPWAPQHPYDEYEERVYRGYEARGLLTLAPEEEQDPTGYPRIDPLPLLLPDVLGRLRSLHQRSNDLRTGDFYHPPRL
jgi:hypothetical protein